MYKIIFYTNKNGKSDIVEYLKKLQKKKDKSSKLKSNKIIAYINMLEKEGLNIGEPYIKHIYKNIWELRPLRDRIFFAYYDNSKFILLNYFVKQTRKTPKRELEKAIKFLNDFIRRNENG